MRARVDAAITVDMRDVPPKVLERLCRALSFPNPSYAARRRHGRLRNSDVEPETLCYMEQRGRELRLPRGAIHLLRTAAAEQRLSVVCDDARILPSAVLGPLPELPLRDYQRLAVDKLAKVTQGLVILPCGGGKTRIGMGAIARLRTPTLILVHTLDLAEQWRGELQTQLGLTPGLIGGGDEHDELVTVAVIQSLVRWPSAKLDAFLRRFGLLVLDEAHHVPASSFHSVVDRCPARYRLGLTATPEREDGLSTALALFLGAPLLVVTHDQLVSAGVLTLPTIRSVETDFTYPYNDAEQYAALLTTLAADASRNRLILDIVTAEASSGQVCLVLSGRVDHCEQLAASLQDRGISAAALTSTVKRSRRKALLDQARAGELAVLVATSLADEGLDLPRLSRVFLVYPGRARGRTVQRLGRLMRPHADKRDAVLFDFVDRKVPILRRHHLERQRLYAEVLGISPHTSNQRSS